MARKIPWTLPEIMETTKKYSNRADWAAENAGQYDAVLRHGWKNEIYKFLPRKRPVLKFTDNEIILAAQSCKTFKDLERLNPAYARAVRKRPHIKNEATSHMVLPELKKDYLYTVYSFAFEDDAFYVGITRNPHSRFIDHTIPNSKTVVGKYIQDNPKINYEYSVLHSDLKTRRAQEREGYILMCAINVGLRPLNSAKTGALGGSQVWDIEIIKKIMLKYDNVTDAYKKDKKAYNAAANRGILAEVTAHMTRKNKVWSMDECSKDAMKYKTFAEWRKNSQGANQFVRQLGHTPSEFFKQQTQKDYTLFQRIFWNSTAKNDKDVAWAWANADILLQMWLDNDKCGFHKLYSLLSLGSYSAYRTIEKQFKSNWRPQEDSFWLEWSAKQREEMKKK